MPWHTLPARSALQSRIHKPKHLSPAARLLLQTQCRQFTVSISRRGPLCSGTTKVARGNDILDNYLAHHVHNLKLECSVYDLYKQYQDRAGATINRVIPYEERPAVSRRADSHVAASHRGSDGTGDGVVLVVYAATHQGQSKPTKFVVCSGFVVNASVSNSRQGDTVVTCAHTLMEMQRYIRDQEVKPSTFSFIVTFDGKLRPVSQLLSALPGADTVVLESSPSTSGPRLNSLPLSPYAVQIGAPVLTYLFGSPDPPTIKHSIAKTSALSPSPTSEHLETSIPILDNNAYRRWGKGIMLGYRSYTGFDVEADHSEILPHILTSVLPTPGSSGGPLVSTETGAVVGMISGRRMDNRVEGERGWGSSAEVIFEMFSLPGFMPKM